MSTDIGELRLPESGSIPLASTAFPSIIVRTDTQTATHTATHTATPTVSRTAATDGAPASTWLSRYVAALVVLDALALLLGGALGNVVRFSTLDGRLPGVVPFGLLLALTPAWLFSLAAARTYEGRFLGVGSEEYRRVGNAAARFTALLVALFFLVKADVSRGLVVVALPAATAFTLVLRFSARKLLHRLRADGTACHRVLLVGEGGPADILANRMRESAHSGLQVVGSTSAVDPGSKEPTIDHIPALAASLRADTVTVVHTPHMTPDLLRRLAWALEGTGVDLLVAPGLTDVAGPRINIRPVSGLPLLQIAAPEYTGVRRLVKGAIDLIGAGLAVAVFSPLLAAVALAVRLSGPGPVLFRQERIGRNGTPFPMLKFRSMHTDAEERLAELRALNDHGDGILFKLRHDPRITRVGGVLRRYSLDELPQLFNVLAGHMSLVGPRPPLPDEVARYETDVHRRLLVKPGITGLWQVSGRSDLSWDETVRLDLYYVENWSVMFDLEILWKTVRAVLRGSGAR